MDLRSNKNLSFRCISNLEARQKPTGRHTTCRRPTKPETVWEAASRLLADRKVSARVEEMHKLAEGQTLFAVEQALLEFEEARKLAMDNGQPSAAVAAITGKAKLFGMMADKRYVDHRSGDHSMSPNGRPRIPFDPGMSLEEMEQFFAEELRKGK